MTKLKYENDVYFSEHAKQRLKKSYMKDDETSPQERFRFVADSFASNQEHADRMYNYASDLWVSFSTPILAYGKNKGSLGISCFEENTLVETENGLVKIKDLKIGDRVLSHDGKYHPVKNTKTQESTDTYHLEFNSESFFVTGNHLILTKEDGWVRVDELCQLKHTILSIYHRAEMRNMNFKLQKINKKMTVVDIEVDESHTFTVGKSKMIVHNCYLPYIEDTKESLFKKSTESRILSTLGGGVGLGMGIRPRDEKSTGVMPHAKTYDADVIAYKQGESRRGAVAIYLDVTHPEIMEFITIRDPFGGDANRKSLNIHHGVNITDDFMERVETLSTKELSKAEIEEIDKWVTYHPSGVTRVESVKDIFEKILETRLQTGEPYLHFIDTSNKFLPKFQKDLGLTVKQSNLCFKGDTLVWTVNGGNLTIKELAESSAGKNAFLVYSASFKNGEWVEEISKAVAFQTGVLETIKVVLSNGKYFECTPEHKIALLDGSYEQARNLMVGQELVSVGEKIFVENIEFDETFTPVYDLTVENNHNFFIKFDKFDENGDSVLVHNCSEIIEPTGTDYMGVNRTAICCLASVNISKYDEWKDNTQFIQDIVEFLDNVIQSFIDDAIKIGGLEDVVHSAKMERAIGIGAMGFHDYLQQKMIAFESPMAVGLNKRIFKFIKENADIATQRLAVERGACPDYLEWIKRCNPTDEEIAQNPPVRNSQTTSVAPNASSSVILNTSPSIEPYRANVYREEGDAGVFIRRNQNLVKLLEEKGMNTDETWSIITGDDGSVRSLKFLTDYEKDVFKTAIEIDQLWIIQHASDRQEYISQAQSLNLFFSPTVAIEYVAYIHLLAWKMGLKSIYYGRSDALTKVGKLGKSLEREKIAQLQQLVVSDEDICLACQ